MKGFILEVNSRVMFSMILVYYLESQHNIHEDEFEKHPIRTMSQELGISCKTFLLGLYL